jgi:hypothetical protein
VRLVRYSAHRRVWCPHYAGLKIFGRRLPCHHTRFSPIRSSLMCRETDRSQFLPSTPSTIYRYSQPCPRYTSSQPVSQEYGNRLRSENHAYDPGIPLKLPLFLQFSSRCATSRSRPKWVRPAVASNWGYLHSHVLARPKWLRSVFFIRPPK